MVKRELSAEEKALVEKSLVVKQKQKAFLEYQKKYNALILGEGLEQNYINQRMVFERNARENEAELDLVTQTIEELNKQMTEGVEMKEEAAAE